METLTLITIHGDQIEIEYPDSIIDEFIEDFNQARTRLDFWNVGSWCDARAMFKGNALSDINMALIIGVR